MSAAVPVSSSRDSAQATLADRKIVLMRMLARAEATRLDIEPTESEVRDVTRWFRAQFGLRSLPRFAAWLRHARLDLAQFHALMADFASLTKVLVHYEADVDRELHAHLAIHTVHGFGAQEGT